MGLSWAVLLVYLGSSRAFAVGWWLPLGSWRLSWAGTSKMTSSLPCLVSWCSSPGPPSLPGVLSSAAFLFSRGQLEFLHTGFQEHRSVNCQAFSRLRLRTSTSVPACPIGKVSCRTSPDSVWEGDANRCGCSKARFIEGHFANWLPQKGSLSPSLEAFFFF